MAIENGLKLAVTGKGGVGKSTVAAALALTLARRGQRVLALDADPDANLASALGIPGETQKSIQTISGQLAFIEERTGTTVNEYGRVFKLNPEVSDVAEKFGFIWKGVNVLVLGAVQNGGGGCACPESTFIKALITDLVVYKNETLIMDMEAGVEHLGRATASGVDGMLVVVEPGKRSVDCALTVLRMAREIGIGKFWFVGNKITVPADGEYLRQALPDADFISFIPYSPKLREADRDGVAVTDCVAGEAALINSFERIYRAVEDGVSV
jgi:CO dehydrogenase maturation factor